MADEQYAKWKTTVLLIVDIYRLFIFRLRAFSKSINHLKDHSFSLHKFTEMTF